MIFLLLWLVDSEMNCQLSFSFNSSLVKPQIAITMTHQISEIKKSYATNSSVS